MLKCNHLNNPLFRLALCGGVPYLFPLQPSNLLWAIFHIKDQAVNCFICPYLGIIMKVVVFRFLLKMQEPNNKDKLNETESTRQVENQILNNVIQYAHSTFKT